MAEEVGFEPTRLSPNGFQDRLLKPLGHSSVTHCLFYHAPAGLSIRPHPAQTLILCLNCRNLPAML